MRRIKEKIVLVSLMLALLLAACDSVPSCNLVALAGGADIACEEEAGESMSIFPHPI
ncbi:MAG: hypothetical protein Q8L87_11095 [Anaerolineales bacterium]|jgi:uncharacterized lipoprotein YmbA|nr:hypothetical protein [Anaerolineales bacterium]